MSFRLSKLSSRDSAVSSSYSTLDSNDGSKEILPTVKIRNRLNSGNGSNSITNIYIPFVQEDLTNDNDDLGSTSSVESGFVVGHASSRKSKATPLYGSPIKSANDKEITIEVDDIPKKQPLSSQLDILESHLPKNLRNEALVKTRLRIKEQNHYDLMKTLHGDEPSKKQKKKKSSTIGREFNINNGSDDAVLQPNGSIYHPNESLLSNTQFLSVVSYAPKHYSSGALSVDSTTEYKPIIHFDDESEGGRSRESDSESSFSLDDRDKSQRQLHQLQNQHHPNHEKVMHVTHGLEPMQRSSRRGDITSNSNNASNIQVVQTMAPRKPTLWISTSEHKDMIEREENVRKELEEKIRLAKEREKLMEIENAKVKIKSLNTLYDSKWRLGDVVDEARLKFIKLRKKVKSPDSGKVGDYDDSHDIDDSSVDGTMSIVLAGSEENVEPRAKRMMEEDYDDDDDYNIVPPTGATMVNNTSSRQIVKGRSDSYDSGQSSSINNSSTTASIPPFDPRDSKSILSKFLTPSDLKAKFNGKKQLEAMRDHTQAELASANLISTVYQLSESDMKHKLKNLAAFINSHTSRKLLDSWNFIEAKFRSSNMTKARVEPGANGLSMQVKHPAINAGNLIFLLCSSKIRVGNEEIIKLLTALNLTSEQIIHARKIAALQVVTTAGSEGKGKLYEMFYKQLLDLSLSRDDALVSVADLIDVVFSSDKNEREGQLDVIAKNKTAQVNAMIEEKKQKDELRKQTELRRQRMMRDFEENLQTAQILRGMLTESRMYDFLKMVRKSTKYVEQQRENQASNIPAELIAFIGLDAFPSLVIEKIQQKERLLAIRRKKFKEQNAEAAAKPMFKENPFLSKNRKKTKQIDKKDQHKAVTEKSQSDLKKSRISEEVSSMDEMLSSINAGSTVLPSSLDEHSLGSYSEMSDDLDSMITSETSVTNDSKSTKLKQALPKVLLCGPPVILSVLRDMVSFGRGLNGMSYQEAVTILQYVSATKIMTLFRCHRKRWRYNTARVLWRRKDLELQRVYHLYWKAFVTHVLDNRNYLWRKLKAWKFYTKRIKRRQNIFRVTFWPFYTWRKYSTEQGTAGEKTKFLVYRLMPTILQIRVFKAWKIFTKSEVFINTRSRTYNSNLIQKRSLEMLKWLYVWARKRRLIRRSWLIRGKSMLSEFLFQRVFIPFMVWRAYSVLRKNVRQRSSMGCFDLRRAILPIMPTKMMMKKTSNSQKRIKMKVIYLKQFQQTADLKPKKRVKTKEAKKNLKDRVKAKKNKSLAVLEEEDLKKDDSNFEKPSTDNFKPYIPIGDFFDEVGQLTKKYFRWNLDLSEMYDIFIDDSIVVQQTEHDSDDDSNFEITGEAAFMDENHIAYTLSDDIPRFISNQYQQIEREPLQPISFIDKYQRNKILHNHIQNVFDLYTKQEELNCFEGAFRFHRYGCRVFNNLRHFAKSRIKARKFIVDRNNRLKLRILKELKHMAFMKLEREKLAKGSEAESLALAVRNHHVSKLVLTRKITADINNAFGRDDGDNYDEEDARIRRIRNLNLIDPEDEAYLEQEKLRLLARREEIKQRQLEREKKYKPPNLLEIDRLDRDVEQENAEKMVTFSQKVTVQSIENVKVSDDRHERVRFEEARIQNMLGEVLDDESNETSQAIALQTEYAADFKTKMAEIMLNTIYKVYVEVQVSMIKEEAKIYFRILRIPMLLSRSKSMYRRKKLLNMLRICNRLRAIHRKAPFYQKIRSMWVIFNRWLKYVAIEKLNPTPGFIDIIRRKAELHPEMERILKISGLTKSVYVDNVEMSKAMTTTKMIFSRWKKYTQEEILFTMMENKVVDLYNIQLVQKCFQAMKTGLYLAEVIDLIKSEPIVFTIVRIKADIEQIIKRFIGERRRSVIHTVRRFNRKYVRYIIQDGRKTLSFKGFMNKFQEELNSRINTEQRMLSDAFELRGMQDFIDVRAPPKSSNIIPLNMSKLDGRSFSDPHLNNSDGRAITIPSGFRLSRLKFSFQHGYGLIGWQLFWTADGAKEIESLPRGAWHAMAISIHEFKIPKDDFLIGVEYLYDGIVMVGIRLNLLNSGYTKWIGGKTSMSTLSIYLDVDIAPREEFEDERESTMHPDEKADPALPFNVIIGFTGMIYDSKVTCLGLVIRKIKKQHLFSYTWVGDALQRIEIEKTAKAVLGSEMSGGVVSLDAKSIPTHLSPTGFQSKKLIKEFDSITGATIYDSVTMSVVHNAEDHKRRHAMAGPEHVAKAKEVFGLGDDSTTTVDSHSHIDQDSRSLFDAEASLTLDHNSSIEFDDNKTSAFNPIKSKRAEERREAVAKGFTTNKASGVDPMEMAFLEDGLSSSEVQFFDIIRMRTTELSHSVERALNFSRRIWSDKSLKLHSKYGKLIKIRLISGLSRWFFNALSRRLIPYSSTEKPALQLLKKSKSSLLRSDILKNKARMMIKHAEDLMNAKQSWSGKALLGPQERKAKKDYMTRIDNIRKEVMNMKAEEKLLREVAMNDEKRGLLLLPHILLTKYVVNNYKLKLEASRHKESLLERMTLEDIKNGLFGTNLKEKMLSKDQMQAIHASLKLQKIKLKDMYSLDKFVEDIFQIEKQELLLAELDKVSSDKKKHHRLSRQQINNLNSNRIGSSSSGRKGNIVPRLRSTMIMSDDVDGSNSNGKLIMTDRTSTPSVVSRNGTPAIPMMLSAVGRQQSSPSSHNSINSSDTANDDQHSGLALSHNSSYASLSNLSETVNEDGKMETNKSSSLLLSYSMPSLHNRSNINNNNINNSNVNKKVKAKTTTLPLLHKVKK